MTSQSVSSRPACWSSRRGTAGWDARESRWARLAHFFCSTAERADPAGRETLEQVDAARRFLSGAARRCAAVVSGGSRSFAPRSQAAWRSVSCSAQHIPLWRVGDVPLQRLEIGAQVYVIEQDCPFCSAAPDRPGCAHQGGLPAGAVGADDADQLARADAEAGGVQDALRCGSGLPGCPGTS